MRNVSSSELSSVFQTLPKGLRIIASGNFATPKALLKLADETISEFRLFMLGAQEGIPSREGVIFESPFLGPGMRRNPRLNYVPCRLSLVPLIIKNSFVPKLVLLHVSAVRNGKVSLGVEVNVLPAAIEAARANGGIVVAQSNPQMPYTFGDGEIDLEDVDFLIEVDEPLTEAPEIALGQTALEIGAQIAALVESGSTLQLGIGGIPNSVISSLGKHRDLRIWTEMFSDGVLDLYRRGAIDAEVPLTASFLFGSRDLYDWVNVNDRVQMLRTETTNDPARISRQKSMTSVNAALQVDLYDQANAAFVRGVPYSGIGGSTDFIVGALHSPGGKSFMALPSMHDKTNTSNLMLRLAEPVTSFQHSYVVTEQGVAECFGRSSSDQAKNLIRRAAHPNVREALTAEAIEVGLISA